VEKHNDISIQKVANGYLIGPSRGPESGYTRGPPEVYVFETFERMVVWLAQYFEDKEHDKKAS
jgi:hypothetical protein